MNVINKLNHFQATKTPWIILSFTMIFLVFLGHFFFQNYLFMKPCEQCVYIRFMMIVLFFVGIVSIFSTNNYTKIIVYALAFWACYLGINYSITLDKIHLAIASHNPFAKAPSCKMIPIFPFSLPLHEYFPELFKPTGLCGYDAPTVPKDVNISSLQEFFVGSSEGNFKNGLYSNGWFLIPSIKFMNMANATLLCFAFTFIVLFAMFLGYLKANIFKGLVAILLAILLIFLN